MANTDQADTDSDGVGDACDNCHKTSNFGQVRSEINERQLTCMKRRNAPPIWPPLRLVNTPYMTTGVL